jgi:hypothetical protein
MESGRSAATLCFGRGGALDADAVEQNVGRLVVRVLGRHFALWRPSDKLPIF